MAQFALITGASKGIGKSIVTQLAKRKNNVLLVARTEALLQEQCHALQTEYGIQAFYLVADLANPAAPAQVFDWCNKNNYQVNILVNNAGYALAAFLHNIPPNNMQICCR